MASGLIGDVLSDLTKTVNIERLCVAARGVVQDLPGLMDDGLVGNALEDAAHHAVTLANLDAVQVLALPDVRAHGTALCEALTVLGSERALTHAVWFADALIPR